MYITNISTLNRASSWPNFRGLQVVSTSCDECTLREGEKHIILHVIMSNLNLHSDCAMSHIQDSLYRADSVSCVSQ